MKKRGISGVFFGSLFAGVVVMAIVIIDEIKENKPFLGNQFLDIIIIVLIILPISCLAGIVFSEKIVNRVYIVRMKSILLGYLFNIMGSIACVMARSISYGLPNTIIITIILGLLGVIMMSSFTYGGYYLGSYDNERGK